LVGNLVNGKEVLDVVEPHEFKQMLVDSLTRASSPEPRRSRTAVPRSSS